MTLPSLYFCTYLRKYLNMFAEMLMFLLILLHWSAIAAWAEKGCCFRCLSQFANELQLKQLLNARLGRQQDSNS